ncbi:MAG: DUF4388 domain-containing protein [Desulfotalea sp.]
MAKIVIGVKLNIKATSQYLMTLNVFRGIELGSYIQILCVDKQTCLLRLKIRDRIGVLCVKDGELLNAQTRSNEETGKNREIRYKEEAVLEMLSWDKPQIEMLPLNKPVKKEILKSLEYLLLESVRYKDERQALCSANVEPVLVDHIETDTIFPTSLTEDLSILTDELKKTHAIMAYLLLDNKGSVMQKHDDTNTLDADFLSFVQFTYGSYDIKLQAVDSGPRHVDFSLKNGSTIMVYCLESNVIGFVVNSAVESDSILPYIEPLLSKLQGTHLCTRRSEIR